MPIDEEVEEVALVTIPLPDATASDPLPLPEESEIEVLEYTSNISDDLVVSTYADGILIDQSGPFDTSENASIWGLSFKTELAAGNIKPNFRG